MADKTSIWFQRSGVLQIKNLSITGNFKHKGDLILWNKPSKRQKNGEKGGRPLTAENFGNTGNTVLGIHFTAARNKDTVQSCRVSEAQNNICTNHTRVSEKTSQVER